MQEYLLKFCPRYRQTCPTSNPIRIFCFEKVSSKMFNPILIFCIIGNTLVLSMEHYNMGTTWYMALCIANNVFTVLFCLETITKIVAFGWKAYFAVGWNIFDFVVSWMAFPSLITTWILSQKAFWAWMVFNVVRSARIFILLRLSRHLNGMRRILRTSFVALPYIMDAIIAIALVTFVFAVIGATLFDGVMPLDPYMLNKEFFNFNNVGNAMMTLIVAASGRARRFYYVRCS